MSHPGEEADLRVPGFDDRVVHSGSQSGLYPGTVEDQSASQLHERLESAALCPANPGVEAGESLRDGARLKDAAKGFLEKVGSIEGAVELRYPAQGLLLRRGEILGVLPEGPASVLESIGHLGFGSRSQVVPDLSTDLVQGLGRPLNDMEGVEATDGLRSVISDSPFDPGGSIRSDDIQGLGALGAELGEEQSYCRGVASGMHPDETSGEMIDDDRQVLLPLAIADFVDTDTPQAIEKVYLLWLPSRRPLPRGSPSATPPS